MSGPAPPPIIVTLSARGVVEARAQIEQAAAAGADGAELRIDRWTPTDRARPAELAGASIPLWATYRSSAEGGEGASEPAERARTLEAFAGAPFAFLDLEGKRDLPLDPGLAGRLRAPGAPRVVVSFHGALDPGDPATEIGELFARAGALKGIVKLVIPADTDSLITRLLPFWTTLAGGPRILHTTGGSGAVLRAGARRLGLAGVFASPVGPRAELPVEPSQIPVDRMRWLFDGPVEAPLFAVLGRPIARSRSPEIHSRWLRRFGFRGLYCAIEVGTPEGLARALEYLSVAGYLGVNVTTPLKRTAFELARHHEPEATRAGAANTLTLTEGAWTASNTDVTALLSR
ncbi:MAG: type I 3-dehydroquinate dehydratase, partial [Thermoplasmata archaeon]